jgi:hypothetical protein
VVPPIRRPLVNYRHLSLPGVVCRDGGARVHARCGVARPWSRVFGTEIRTSHPSGSRCWSGFPAPAPLARFRAPRKSSVPGRVQGLRTAVVSYPDERGASTWWLATWAHLRQRAKRRGAGAQSGVEGFTQARSRAPCPRRDQPKACVAWNGTWSRIT